MTPEIEHGPWWETGVLDKQVHGRLIQRRGNIARRSGLGDNISAMWTKHADTVTDIEREWGRAVVRKQLGGRLGPMYFGNRKRVRQNMVSLTGAFLRNFTDAQIKTVRDICDIQFDRENVFKCTVLFVPDPISQMTFDGMHPSSKNAFVQLIADRITRREATALYAPSKSDIQTVLGAEFANMVATEMFAKEV